MGKCSAFRSRCNTTTSVDPDCAGHILGRGVGEALASKPAQAKGAFTVEMLFIGDKKLVWDVFYPQWALA